MSDDIYEGFEEVKSDDPNVRIFKGNVLREIERRRKYNIRKKHNEQIRLKKRLEYLRKKDMEWWNSRDKVKVNKKAGKKAMQVIQNKRHWDLVKQERNRQIQERIMRRYWKAKHEMEKREFVTERAKAYQEALNRMWLNAANTQEQRNKEMKEYYKYMDSINWDDDKRRRQLEVIRQTPRQFRTEKMNYLENLLDTDEDTFNRRHQFHMMTPDDYQFRREAYRYLRYARSRYPDLELS